MTLTVTSHLEVWRRLASARWELDVSRRQLAQLVGTRSAVLERLSSLTPERHLEFSILHRVCATLGITVGQLLAVHAADTTAPLPTDAAAIYWPTAPTPAQITAVTFENRLPTVLEAAADLARRAGIRPAVLAQHQQGSKSIGVALLVTLMRHTEKALDELFVVQFPDFANP